MTCSKGPAKIEAGMLPLYGIHRNHKATETSHISFHL